MSTIIPVHNRANMLTEAVASVLRQDYRPIEVIVVDDGSTDETWRNMQELAQAHPELRLFRRDRGGPGAARETGRLAALGEYIQYLDSDDLLLPGKFKAQVAALAANPKCGVSYGMTRFRRANGDLVDGAWKGSGRRVETMFPAFLVSRWWDTPNPLYRKELCDRAGPWLPTRVEEDWEYDCRIASFGVRLAYVPAFVCEVRDHCLERLSRGGLEPARMRERAVAQSRIYDHARAAGLDPAGAEMLQFSRGLFLLSRQCGAAGLADEAQKVFQLALEASRCGRGREWDFKLFGTIARFIGWRLAGKLACELDRIRPQ